MLTKHEKEKLLKEKEKQKKTVTPRQPREDVKPLKKKKLSYKDQRELETIESTISTAEAKLLELTRSAELPENSSDSIKLARLSQEMAQTQAEIERLFARWAELEN